MARPLTTNKITFTLLTEINNMPLNGLDKAEEVSKITGASIRSVYRKMRELEYTWTPNTYTARKLVNGSAKRKKETKAIGCIVCGETRVVDSAHLIPYHEGGDNSPFNIIGLCPTHHRLFDSYQLSEDESLALEYICGWRYKSLWVGC